LSIVYAVNGANSHCVGKLRLFLAPKVEKNPKREDLLISWGVMV